MTDEQKANIRYLIKYYDERSADWSVALEYEVRKFNGSLPHQELWPKKPMKPRKKRSL
jgi:hypothetical protein